MTAKTGDTCGGRGTGLWSGRCVAGSAVCVSIPYENGNSLQTSIRLLHLSRRDPSPASSALHLSRFSNIEHYKHVKKTSPSMERGAKWGHVPGCPCPHAPHAHSFRHMDQARLRGALCAPNPPLTRQRATLPTEIQTKSARANTQGDKVAQLHRRNQRSAPHANMCRDALDARLLVRVEFGRLLALPEHLRPKRARADINPQRCQEQG